tara:strand:+ start:397 stop:576 length:180 start_codon:yes stop_codon:yes gene_type:complete
VRFPWPSLISFQADTSKSTLAIDAVGKRIHPEFVQLEMKDENVGSCPAKQMTPKLLFEL